MANEGERPGVFQPLTIRGLQLPNRFVMSPMLMYAANLDGSVNDVVISHYAARLLGGVGLVMSEVVAVRPEGRISARDIGLWNDAHIDGIKRLTDIAHSLGGKFGVQLAHAGRKSEAPSQSVSASSAAYGKLSAPVELSVAQIREIVEGYRDGAIRAIQAGVDALEIHAGHGYLLHSFLSPLTNTRADDYGGSFAARFKLLEEIVLEVRNHMPESVPLFVRMPASDILPQGIELSDGVRIAQSLEQLGVDVLDVSTGNLEPGYANPVFPGYQLEYSERIKEAVGVPTAAFGSIHSADLADYAVRTEKCDLVFVGRPLLRNPFWVHDEAQRFGIDVALPIPTYSRATGPYQRGF